MATTFKLRRAFFAQPWRQATALASCVRSTVHNLRSTIATPRALLATTVALALTANIASALATYPHTLSYFNELAGGPLNGPAHLLDANVDWGQDLLFLKQWYDAHPEARPLHLAWFGFLDPTLAGIVYEPVPGVPFQTQGGFLGDVQFRDSSPSDWHALSVNDLYGYNHFGERCDTYRWLRQLPRPIYVSSSIRVFHIPLRSATRTIDLPQVGPKRGSLSTAEE